MSRKNHNMLQQNFRLHTLDILHWLTGFYFRPLVHGESRVFIFLALICKYQTGKFTLTAKIEIYEFVGRHFEGSQTSVMTGYWGTDQLRREFYSSVMPNARSGLEWRNRYPSDVWLVNWRFIVGNFVIGLARSWSRFSSVCWSFFPCFKVQLLHS